jgi:hypothetical protein
MVYMASTKGLFKVDEATRMVSVETLVVLTTMLLVVRFIVDFMGPRVQSGHCRYHHRDGELFPSALYHGDDAAVGGEGEQLLPGVGGAAGRSAVQRQDRAPVQQVHANPPARHHGLLVGGQSHPRTDLLLKIPLWLIWALNAARIIYFFSSSEKAEAIHQESMRFVADYMSYEHKLVLMDGL